MIEFYHNGVRFAVQAYLKGDFANICEINGDSFRICFTNKTIETSGKQSERWRNKAKQIDIRHIDELLDDLLNSNKNTI